jgi:predicted anti-sigma-YlaC factor YlaD
MKGEYDKCDQNLLSRYIDNELGSDDHHRVSEHIKDCPACQMTMQENQLITETFKNRIGKELSGVTFDGLHKKVITKVREKEKSRLSGLHNRMATKKLFFSLPIAAVLILIITISFFNTNYTTDPSAIVNSINTKNSSVMILETQESHMTVIWFNEAS